MFLLSKEASQLQASRNALEKGPGMTLGAHSDLRQYRVWSLNSASALKAATRVMNLFCCRCMVFAWCCSCVCVNIAVSPAIVKLASVYRQHTRVGHRNLLRRPSIISTPTSFVESACSLAPHQRHHPRLVSTQLWYSIVVIHDHAYDDCDSSYYDYCSRAVVAAVSTQLWYSQYS